MNFKDQGRIAQPTAGRAGRDFAGGKRGRKFTCVYGLVAWLATNLACAAEVSVPVSDVVMKALNDELSRSVTLHMEDLEKPYFVQYNVEDSLVLTLTAEDGDLTGDLRQRQRDLRTQVRVGSYELDNTHFAGGGGADGTGRSPLPVEDDYLALRQGAWLATDRVYKDAVETLTQKRAYMKDKNIMDRPHDFSAAPAVEKTAPAAAMQFDETEWQANLRKLSAYFKRFEIVQDSSVRLIVGVQNLYIVNSEGTRLRVPDTGAILMYSAQVQAADGMRLTDGRLYAGLGPADFPKLDQILKDIDETVASLDQTRQASVLERYSGPVLFDGVAGAQMFDTLLAAGLAGKPDIVGEQRRSQSADSFEYKLGTRLLPSSFQVWDDPAAERYDGTALLGHYEYDDEAVAARKVELVKDGKLNTLCLSRAPTRKLSGSNGHGRSASGSPTVASVANLFVEDQKGLSDEELKAELISAAKDEGLDFGLRVKAIQMPSVFSSRMDLISYFGRAARGGGSKLGDPILAYKVSVKDGAETPVRGLEFAPLEVRALKHILAAGTKRYVFNHLGLDYSGSAPPVAVVAPAVLLEEAELSRIQEEYDKAPLLKSPLFRQ